jgi:hypothetical protein
MQDERSACFGSGCVRVFSRAGSRSFALALGSALTLSILGCTLSLSPLAKHTAEFSTATATLVDGSKNAYLAANKLHLDEQTAMAVDSYGAPGWSPYTELKPLLTPDQLAARTKVLDALKAYADGLAGLTETKDRYKKLQDASASAGSNLASLSTSGIPGLQSLFPGTTEASGASTAIAGLAQLLINGRVKKALAKTTADMDPNIQALCTLLASDAKTLQTAADRDYKGPIENLDEFLAHHPGTDPVARRLVVGRMISLAQQQRLNDAMLAKLQLAVSALGQAHKALADAAAGKDPETIKQKLRELISLGTELGAYYSSLQAAASS